MNLVRPNALAISWASRGARAWAAHLAFAALPCAAIAQPTVDADLGRFDDVSFRSVVRDPIVIDATTPVRWYTVTLPRIADPHRFLDIWTQNQLSFDTEIALYAPDGTLIASDDDDGADNLSALSFGITNTGAPQRINATAFPGQAAALPNDGRDGAFAGPWPAAANTPGPTAATYYIAVTQYDAAFANNFSVTRTTPPSGLVTSLAVRMNTPAGFTPIGITGISVGDLEVNGTGFFSSVPTGPVTLVRGNLASVGGSPQTNFQFNHPYWDSPIISPPAPAGPRAVPLFAFNALGDVVTSTHTFSLRARGFACFTAYNHPIATTPGLTVYDYDTTYGTLDGPWTSVCWGQVPTGGNDVWLRMIPTVSGTATFSTCNSDTGFAGPQPDTLLGIGHQCFTAGFFACADDTPGCGFGTRLTNIPLTAGQEYNIAVRGWDSDIVNGRLAVILTPGCDPIDFNGDELFPDTQDIADFLLVFGGGACPTTACGDIDFNNDGLFPDTLDIQAFLSVFSGGACEQ